MIGARSAVLILIPLLLLCGCGRSGGGPDILYVVKVAEPPVQRADIEVRISGLSSKQSTLSLAMVERYAYVMLPEPLLGGEIEATGALGNPLGLIREDPYHWTIAKGSEKEIKLRYTVPLIHKSLPAIAGRDEYEQPYIAADHGLLVSGTLFVAPDRSPPASYRVRFETPLDWPVHCPWEETSSGDFAPATLGALWDDLIAIGGWTLRETERRGMDLSIAIAPDQERLEQSAAPFIAEIVDAEIDLFGITPRDKYLVLFVTPIATQMAGSPKTGSITMSIPFGGQFSLPEMSHLIAHEFHHTWIHSICELPDELRFYNEGFTDYFAFLTCTRLGIMSWDRFADEMATKMDACTDNLAASVYSLSDAGGDPFFDDPVADKLVYSGGALVAALLDLELRAADPGIRLEAFMRDFNNDSRWSWSSPPKLEDFLDGLARHLSDARVGHYSALITQPFVLNAALEFSRVGVEVNLGESDRLPAPGAEFSGSRITRLNPAGAAGKIGIRRGDMIRSINGRSVFGPDEIFQAIADSRGGTLRFEIERAGETVIINAALPKDRWHEVTVSPWREGF